MTLTDHVKKRDYLICVDSDGCAMDTMDIPQVRTYTITRAYEPA